MLVSFVLPLLPILMIFGFVFGLGLLIVVAVSLPILLLQKFCAFSKKERDELDDLIKVAIETSQAETPEK